MVNFDKQKFAAALNGNALPPFGRGLCATYVRMALEAAGMDTAGHPVNAKDWGPTLARMGFALVPEAEYVPRPGDIVVIQGTSVSIPGHIEGFDGKSWISDFVQTGFMPGPSFRTEKPAYAIYRWPF